jgi:uncharacterized protein (TIGR00661 family)
LYGVVGEGLGHAMRSRVIAGHLEARGHHVKLAASGRAAAYLARHFEDVQPIPGFALQYAAGGVAPLRSVLQLCRSARAQVRETAALYRRSIAGFQPDVCLSDFDSFAHIFGLLFDRPVLSVDHQHVIDRCDHPRNIVQGVGAPLRLARAIVRAKLPRCRHYVVSSYYLPPLRGRARAATTLVGPILRPEVLALSPARGDHVLVYQTATRDLIAPLFELPEQRFVVYGCGATGTTANVTLREFDERRFLADLASARAVICNGGYTLISEALHLGKPVLSVPLRRHAEQQLNAAYLAALGLGRTAAALDPATMRSFLARVDRTDAGGRTVRIPAGNAQAFAVIDDLLEQLS